MKKRLLRDECLMAAGSDCYGTFYGNTSQNIPLGSQVNFGLKQTCLNVDHTEGDPTVYVRKSGYFLAMFTITTNEPSQFTFFVNAHPITYTTTGINVGAGQLVLRSILRLCENDVVTVVNYNSYIGPVNISSVVGGPVLSSSVELLLEKIAPYDECIDCDVHISRRLRHKFCDLAKQMTCDPCLQIEGSDAYGSFYRTTELDIPLETPVLFDLNTSVYNTQISAAKDVITVCKDGVYFILSLLSTVQFAQFTIFVNGVAELSTVTGTNRGAGVLVMRHLLALKKGDTVSLINHISANGTIQILPNAGSLIPGVAAEFLLTKIAPYPYTKPCKPKCGPCKPKPCVSDEMYRKFRHYLLTECKYNVRGSDAYLDILSQYKQPVSLDQSVAFQILNYKRDMLFRQGSMTTCVGESGVYMAIFDATINEPGQFSIFINGATTQSLISGVESGAGQIFIRQLVELKKGDVVEVKNHQSAIGTVTLTSTSGGYEPASTCEFILYKIANIPCVYKH